MPLRYHVERRIDAAPERVWALLTFTKAIPDLTDSFNLFADGLKAAAEAPAQRPSAS